MLFVLHTAVWYCCTYTVFFSLAHFGWFLKFSLPLRSTFVSSEHHVTDGLAFCNFKLNFLLNNCQFSQLPRHNTETSHVLFTQLPPVVTSYKTVVQDHSQGIMDTDKIHPFPSRGPSCCHFYNHTHFFLSP